MTPAQRHALYARLAAATPAPQTELAYATAFQLLVAVVLSAQSTDRGVNKATAVLFRDAPTPQAIAALGAAGLEPYIASLGLFRTKARNVAALAEAIVATHGGEVPRTREALEALPGVGRKTANVVLNVAFGEPTIAVDTHIFRVANRTGLAPGKDVRAVERALEAATPPAFALHAHHWLILHGRYVCTARAPKCGDCPIADLCAYPDKTGAPAPARRKAPPPARRGAAPARTPAAPAGKPAPRGTQPYAKTARAGGKRGR